LETQLRNIIKFNPSSVSLPPSPDALAFLQSQVENVKVNRHAEEDFYSTSKKLRGEEIDWHNSGNRLTERAGFAIKVDFRLRYQSGPLSSRHPGLILYNIFFRRVSYRIPLGCAMTLSISDRLKWVYIVTITIRRWKLGQKKKIWASDQVQENIG
jgi:hypothetical protein